LITIKHTHEDGTLVYGTRKGDGVYDIIRKWENGNFKFFPSLRMIGLRNSRDRVADRWAINAAAKALREAGFEVEVEIDDTFRDRAQVLEDKADRLEDRRAVRGRPAHPGRPPLRAGRAARPEADAPGDADQHRGERRCAGRRPARERGW
jgi:hypothetical protein